MKKCPYCLSDVQDKAKKCKNCGEWLVGGNNVISKKNNRYNSKIISIVIIGCLVVALILSRLYFINGKKTDEVSESKGLSEISNEDNNKNTDSSSFQKNIECQKYLDVYKRRYKDNEMIGVFYSPKEDACLGYVYYMSYAIDDSMEADTFVIEDAFDDSRFRFAYYQYQYYYDGYAPQCSMHSDYEGTKRDFGPCKPQYKSSTDVRKQWEAEIERLKK